jgi:hypothetical protein
MIGSTLVLSFFAIILLAYYILKFFVLDTYANRNEVSALEMPIGFALFALLVAFQLWANIKNTKELCGNIQLTPAVMYTLIPNILVLGGLNMLLGIFPGWKAPFSNTIGYGITLMLGIKTVFGDMLKTNSGENKILKKIYEDKSILINEMTPGPTGNFDKFVTNLGGENGIWEEKGLESKLPQLYSLVLIKDYVSEYLWYILAGFLVISMSFNSIMGIECKKSEKDLELQSSRLVAKEKTNAGKANAPKYKVFD